MTPATKKQLFDAVHAALVTAFKIPDHDRIQRLIEYAPDDFEIRLGCGERFTLITICAFAGRSLDAKRKLYQQLAERLEPVGIPRNDLFIVIDEHSLENFGLRGGVPASEIDFAFDVKV